MRYNKYGSGIMFIFLTYLIILAPFGAAMRHQKRLLFICYKKKDLDFHV